MKFQSSHLTAIPPRPPAAAHTDTTAGLDLFTPHHHQKNLNSNAVLTGTHHVQIAEMRDKENILLAARGRRHMTDRGRNITIKRDLPETMQAKRKQNDIFKVAK